MPMHKIGKIFVFAGANLNREKGKKEKKKNWKKNGKKKKKRTERKGEKPPFFMSLHLLCASFDALLLNCH
jgi:hypothetical protein